MTRSKPKRRAASPAPLADHQQQPIEALYLTTPADRASEGMSWTNTVLRAARKGDRFAIRDTLLLVAGEIRAGKPIVETAVAAYIADGLTRMAKGEVDPFGARRRPREVVWSDPESTVGRDIGIALHIRWNMSRGTTELESIEQAAELAGVTSSVAKRALNMHRRLIGPGRGFAVPLDEPNLSAFRADPARQAASEG
jgi:hypothetical protein